jgi:hypothetical protein
MKKTGGQKMNPALAAALRAEYKCKLIERIPKEGDPPHPLGITEEHYSDGSKRFTGDGGGVLWVLSDGSAMATPPGKTLPFRVRSLTEVAPMNMPERPLEIGDVENFKGEALAMLEALRTRDAQFFRDIGDALKPREKKTATREEKAYAKWKLDEEVFKSIMAAAKTVGGIPTFDKVADAFRVISGFGSETNQSIKGKLKRRGFQWIFSS